MCGGRKANRRESATARDEVKSMDSRAGRQMMGVGRIFGEPAPEKCRNIYVVGALDNLENGDK